MIADNILKLVEQDASLRVKSLELIDADDDMTDHLGAVETALQAIADHVLEGPERTGDQLTVQALGIRLYNDLAAGLGEGLAGYYQRAFDAIRDVLELQFLFDDFADDATKIGRWAMATRRDREWEFGPLQVRQRLDIRYGHTEQKRREHYQRLTGFASHPSPEGFRLIAPKGLGILGGFVHPKTLRALLEDMARHGLATTVNFTTLLPARTPEEQVAKAHFVERSRRWLEAHWLTAAPGRSEPAA